MNNFNYEWFVAGAALGSAIAAIIGALFIFLNGDESEREISGETRFVFSAMAAGFSRDEAEFLHKHFDHGDI